jgi:hypothetical protein
MPQRLDYKQNLAETLERLRRLYAREAQDEIFATFEIPSEAIERFADAYPQGYCEYPETQERTAFWDAYLGERAALEDDSMPSAYLSELDQGLYGGMFGGDVQFMSHPEIGWVSSMVAPLLDDWSEFVDLQFDREHPWYQRFLEQTRAFVEAAEGKWGISHFILIDGLNFAFELVGATDTYMSLELQPEMARQAIELAYQVNVAVHKDFFDIVGTFEGGTFSNMTEWIPGQIISESVDPFHMTSVDYFEEWGRKPIERIFADFDGGGVHIHGNGRHLLEAVASLQGLKAMSLNDDRGFPLVFDILPDLQARTGDMPLVVDTEFAPFAEALERHTLCGGVLYHIEDCPEADAANRCMEQVRAYRV